MIKKLFHALGFFLLCSSIWGQRVTVSEDINLRSDYVYDILGKVDGKILLYRDKGFNHVLQVFDDNLWEKENIELQFEKKRISVVGLLGGDKDFSFFYTYRSKGDQVLSCRKFDAGGGLIDTTTIHISNALLDFQKYFFAFSTDHRYASLFTFERDNKMLVHMFDTQEMKVLWSKVYIFDFAFMRRDFREFLVADDGGAVVVFEREEFQIGNATEFIEAYYLSSQAGDLFRQSLAVEDYYIIDYKMTYDNTNSKFVLAGLYGERNRSRADGYFMLINGDLQFTAFKQGLFRELEKNNKRKVSSLEDFVVADIVVREDGGILLLAEMQRQFSRKSNMMEGRRQSFDVRAYVDYYNEDLVVFSIHPDGKPHWERVLRKKQFSQDDGGFFSSFFVFKSPRELRIIFNDEIKQDNTVSEYIINPIGENERNIVMNTEYQKLRLRFQEAVQISTRDFIVPSERNAKFNLVKVSF